MSAGDDIERVRKALLPDSKWNHTTQRQEFALAALYRLQGRLAEAEGLTRDYDGAVAQLLSEVPKIVEERKCDLLADFVLATKRLRRRGLV